MMPVKYSTSKQEGKLVSLEPSLLTDSTVVCVMMLGAYMVCVSHKQFSLMGGCDSLFDSSQPQ